MPLKTHLDEQPTLNMTPMIDIVFLLIIFFMVGTKFTEMEHNIKLEVPQVKEFGALTAAPEKRVVNVYRDGTITMNRQTVSSDQLVGQLQSTVRQYPDLDVLIRGDADGPLQNVATVMSACKQAGVSQMGISVRLDRTRR